jgi:hypothetical protein
MAAERTSVSRRAVVVGGSALMPLLVSILAPTAEAAKSPNPGRGKVKIKVKEQIKDLKEKIKEKIKDRRD